MNPWTDQRTEFSGNNNCFNVSNIYNTALLDQRPRILKWLSPLEPGERHHDVRTHRLDGVGDWLLQMSEYANWRDGKDGFEKTTFFCSGDPGVGKTYLSSLVIDDLCNKFRGRGDVVVTCLYCDFLSRKEQSTTSLVGALLKQVVARLESVPTEISAAFLEEKGNLGGRGLLLPDILKLLEMALASLPRVFICVDALDECLTSRLPELLRSLGSIVQASPGVRLFVTGRPHILEEIEKHFTGGVQIIPIKSVHEDIRRFIKTKLEDDPISGAMDEGLKADIMDTVPKTASGVFLLASLNITAILGETTISRRREKLRKMCTSFGLGDAYNATLVRMKEQIGDQPRLGIAALMWISQSERPLRTDEICQALAVEVGATDFDPQNVPSIRTLLGCCLGLVTVDAEASTVRLIHSTLQEYLSTRSDIFQKPHSAIAEVCLTFLNFRCIKELPPTLRAAPKTTPFLEYASCYWGIHARKETTELVKSLALDLLERYDSHISAKLLLMEWKALPWYFDLGDRPEGFTGLHCIAFLGANEIATFVMKTRSWDVNKTDFTGRTPLLWAAEYGNEGVAKVLLQREDVNPDSPYVDGRTPLSWAARYGFEGIVRRLLARKDINPDLPDNNGRTPLSWAAHYAREATVRLLLERKDVNPDSPDNNSRTPLFRAAECGNEGVLKLLLKRKDVNPNFPDKNRRTPLFRAIEYGNESVVKILLECKKVNPNFLDKDCRTPLSRAAGYKNEGIVRLLVADKNVNPNIPDEDGRAPLFWAAAYGVEDAVKGLLERDDLDPNLTDEKGRTALVWAVSAGREKIVELLLERRDVNPNLPDHNGRTPFLWAVMAGWQNVVELLLKRGDINTHVPDHNGQTALAWIAQNGSRDVVKRLLERKEHDLDTTAAGSGAATLRSPATPDDSKDERTTQLREPRPGGSPDPPILRITPTVAAAHSITISRALAMIPRPPLNRFRDFWRYLKPKDPSPSLCRRA